MRTVLGRGVSLLDAAEVERALASGRFATIYLRRNIAPGPVADWALVLGDACIVSREDLVVVESRYADRIGDSEFAGHGDGHRWYSYPALTRNQALLIKHQDSAAVLARFGIVLTILQAIFDFVR